MTLMPQKAPKRGISRRAILKSMAMAPMMFRAAPFWGASLAKSTLGAGLRFEAGLPMSDFRLAPRYPSQSPLADVIALFPPGLDEYVTEKHAAEIDAVFKSWSDGLKTAGPDFSALKRHLDPEIEAVALNSPEEATLRSAFGIDVVRRRFSAGRTSGRDPFIASLNAWLTGVARVETAEFEIFGIVVTAESPLSVQIDVRYDLVSTRHDQRREERIGKWQIQWYRDATQTWIARRWDASDETVTSANGPVFVDITSRALGGIESYNHQLLRGADYWRTVMDGAIGVDVYSNNGIAAGDFDGDGLDDLYICQPAGLPNRLYRNRGDGTFEDVTEKAGVGVLDSTACAHFADFENRGLQDLLVVCGTGPLLFVNQGDGTFALKCDAFRFARPAQGTFTHAALGDYDRDGRLDIYFCTYMYYLGLDQYHYPAPYYDARNGPPNCLFRNEGKWSFVETTEEAGLNADNDRYSFACAWGDSNSDGAPDLFVANDFGSSQLYRNNGDGTFKAVSREAHVESVGAGMSCCWCDFDNDGRQDIYVPSMWEAAGQRVSRQAKFHQGAAEEIRRLYQRHAKGNALYHNKGEVQFENVGEAAGVEMGRWSWCSDFWDFDHDGFSDLYVTNGYISAVERTDLASFFWRQVVAKSPDDTTPSRAYERGWNAINELIRSDNTWHGYARNVLFLNNGNGTFSEASGAVALDFLEDSRSFALADIDRDGRLEVILKNRNAPQIRILHNAMTEIGDAISFRLRGRKSNRDAIGSAVTVEANGLKQTKYLQAGSGFLAQHSKELFFGLGRNKGKIRAVIRWPSGLSQTFDELSANHCIEVEEGAEAIQTRPFDSTPPKLLQTASTLIPELLPADSETWLIQPLKAPEFSLPDLRGNVQNLRSLHRDFALLIFWASGARSSLDLLSGLRQFTAPSGHELTIIAVNVDAELSVDQARSIAEKEMFPFPVLFATPEVAGIYNIIYRHLFDRRRDMLIPTSYLIDRHGMIVKVYQGRSNLAHLAADLESVPASDAERVLKALPFRGILPQGQFARNDFTYGVAMFQHGYLDQAAESFKQVISVKPNNADAYYNLGTLSLRRHDRARARVYLERTLELRPDYPEALNNLGMLAAEEEKFDEAIQRFEASIALRPNYAVALLNLGNVYRKQKAFERARACLIRALELQPDDAEVNYSLGMLYAQQDNMQTASEYLQKALQLRPEYPEALNNLGIVFVHQQNYAKAEEQFRNAIGVSPNFDQSYLNLARLYAMRLDKPRARQVLEDLLQLQPQNSSAKQALEMLQ